MTYQQQILLSQVSIIKYDSEQLAVKYQCENMMLMI
jgi:hypothetical protein